MEFSFTVRRSLIHLFNYPLQVLLVVVLLAGCATKHAQPALPAHPFDVAGCRDYYLTLDRMVDAQGVRDAQDSLIEGFPFLRINRFLLSLGKDIDSADDVVFTAWTKKLLALDRIGRQMELANLSLPATEKSRHSETIVTCGNLLNTEELRMPEQRGQLLSTAHVADEYVTWQRTLGLYWFSAWFVKLVVNDYHQDVLAAYALPLRERPPKHLVSYQPEKGNGALLPSQVKNILARATDNTLNIPELTETDLQRLFAAFAPVWQVETTSVEDRLGAPVWDDMEQPARIDTRQPSVYQHLSFTRFNNRILPQLNYVIWFPSRPRQGILDLLGGHIDGITWRVTIDSDGQPLAYDAMHNCGCYHLFFPSGKLRQRKAEEALQEPAFSPQQAPELPSGKRIVLRIAAVTHFIERVTTVESDADETLSLHAENYNVLRSLPVSDGGRRSLFQANAIVSGTERKERFVIWPMGVPHPGEMRQWGHHATAFFGRRHFDDTDIFERYFE